MWKLPSLVKRNGPLFTRADTGTYRSPHAKTHGAQAAARDEGSRLFEAIVLRSPHLMLTDIGGDDMVVHPPTYCIDNRLWCESFRIHFEVVVWMSLHILDHTGPCFMSQRGCSRSERCKHCLRIAIEAQGHFDVLSDLGRVDIDL